VAAIESNKDKFVVRKIAVVVVTFESLEGAKNWIEETGSNLPVYVDPNRKMYDLFGLSRSISKVFHSEVMRYYGEGLVKQGSVPQSHGQSDFLQMGGDFTVSQDGKLVFSYPSQNASDRPHIKDILETPER